MMRLEFHLPMKLDDKNCWKPRGAPVAAAAVGTLRSLCLGQAMGYFITITKGTANE